MIILGLSVWEPTSDFLHKAKINNSKQQNIPELR